MNLLFVCLSAAVVCCGLTVGDKLPAAGTLARQVEDDTLSGGPYAPSGWQPDGPQLQLPHREYGAPENDNGVEVSKENIVLVGQLVGTEVQTVPATTISSRYLPPTDAEEKVVSAVNVGNDAIGQVCMYLAWVWWLEFRIMHDGFLVFPLL